VAQANPLANSQKVVTSSAISSAEAQKIALAHKAQMEAFHGRLAGIKHTVDDLNHKLDDLENKS
jgi:ubiquinone biosynthesis protein UbiJ